MTKEQLYMPLLTLRLSVVMVATLALFITEPKFSVVISLLTALAALVEFIAAWKLHKAHP